VLSVRGLVKAFRPTRRSTATIALGGVDLDVPDGAFASVLGPSGSGKTTLLRCVAGFERPDAGTVTLGGRVLVSDDAFVRPYDRSVGIVPQEGALFPHLSVADNVGFGLVGARRAGRRARVEELLELVGLAGLGERRPDQLSGGQQQRVAVARALATEPELILLDEPFSALDAQLRADVRTEVRELLRGLGSTVVLVTHDQAEAMSVSDHLIVMRDGLVVAAGDPREVYAHPADLRLGRFLGQALVLDGEIIAESSSPDGAGAADDVGRAGARRAQCLFGSVPISAHSVVAARCRLLIRPEQLSLAAPAEGSGHPAVVRSQSYFGHDALVWVAVDGLAEEVAVRVPGSARFTVGERTALQVIEPVMAYPIEPLAGTAA